MLRLSFTRLSASVQVVCLTMNPTGGAVGDALRQLGYKTYDIRACFGNPNGRTHPPRWLPVLERRADLDRNIFDGYDAVVGVPGSVNYEQTIQVMPEYTKFILIEEQDKVRHAQQVEVHTAPLMALLHKIKSKSKVAGEWARVFEAIWPHLGNTERHAESLDEMERYVKTTVPAEKLYVYQTGDGWAELCHFLNREEVPKDPFPAENDGGTVLADLHTRLNRAHQAATWGSFLILGLTFIMIFPSVWASDQSSIVSWLKGLGQDAQIASGKGVDVKAFSDTDNDEPKLTGEHAVTKMKAVDMEEDVAPAPKKKG